MVVLVASIWLNAWHNKSGVNPAGDGAGVAAVVLSSSSRLLEPAVMGAIAEIDCCGRALKSMANSG